MLTSMLLACVKPFLQRKGLVGQPGGGLPSTILVFLVQDFVHATALPAMGVRAFFQSASDWVATFCRYLSANHSLTLPRTATGVLVPVSELTYDPSGWPLVLAELAAIAAELEDTDADGTGAFRRHLLAVV